MAASRKPARRPAEARIESRPLNGTAAVHADEDRVLRQIRELLERDYRRIHPQARIAVKRYNPVSIRIRILDPDFADTLFTRRDEEVWKILDELPEELFLQVGMVICLTPREAKSSFANMEFETPAPLTE